MAEDGKLPEIRLFNTLGRCLEPFSPLQDNSVGIYCCGPTVYNYQHIGNLRTYVFEDVLVRMFRFAGYTVKHVMNITDVGHLVSDADDGEDKMAVAVRRERKSSHEIAAYYSAVFFEHCRLLNIGSPDVVCKATEHIDEMIALVSRLEANGLAYSSGGNVYFDVSKFPDYGKLARLDRDSLKAGARIEIDEHKRNAHDFVLWFTSSKFENQELQWDSPWGRGYPGWHLECSAMSMAYLGEEFDIHCGGIDHIPVHHTNEIAQSEGASKRPFAKFWLHGGFLVADKGKMSKSAGGFLTLQDLIDRGYDPLSYRLFCLSGNYRNELAWSWEALDGAANSLKKLKRTVLALGDKPAEADKFDALTGVEDRCVDYRHAFGEAIFQDLSMARALAVLHGVLADDKLPASAKLELAKTFDSVLGLGIESWTAESCDIPEDVARLVELREAARRGKDWAEADRLRDEILDKGFQVEDAKDRTIVRPV